MGAGGAPLPVEHADGGGEPLRGVSARTPLPRGRSVVLIVNWNGRQITLDCIRSLLDSGVDEGDVLVVDNGSGDGSPKAIAAAFPRARQLELPVNLGYAGGANRGLELLLAEGRAEFVLLLNNDTLVMPSVVARLESLLDAHPRAAMAQPKILFFDGRSIENTGCEMDRFGVTVCRGRDAAPEARFDDASFFYASGACVLVRIAALREVGLFDESYFLYCEDVDLAWRLRIAGWGIAYIDAALCLHDESRSMGREATGKMRYIWRNRITTVIKDTGAARLAYVLPATLALAFTVATWNSVTQRRPLYLWLFLKAVGANVARLPATLRKRRAVQKLRRASDREISRSMTPGSFELRMAGARLRRRGGARDEPGRSRAPP